MKYRCVTCRTVLVLEFRRSGPAREWKPHFRCRTCKKIIYIRKELRERPPA